MVMPLDKIMADVERALVVGFDMMDDEHGTNDDIIVVDTAYDEHVLFNDEIIKS